VRVQGGDGEGLVHNRSHPAAESWRWSVGNWNRLSGMPRNAAFASDAACILATWFISFMLYGPVWLGMNGCILFTSCGLSPATSFSNAAFTAPCGPTLASASRTLVLSISHRTRDFAHWESRLEVRLVGEFIPCARALEKNLSPVRCDVCMRSGCNS
jgi:hypothetical protein